MTYTFKLARRLAVSQRLSMLPAILVFAACSGDATAPGDVPGPQVPVAVSINPRHVIIETNQLIRFLASGLNSTGDSVYAPITWTATGGTILPDGRFTSAASGTFMVTGMLKSGAPESEGERYDTSYVEVVRRWPLLSSIQVAPKSLTLNARERQTFLVTGRLKDGRAVPVGTIWNATGGTVDAAGNYVAGDTAGTYRVIATNPTVAISDTALVTIIPLPVQPEVPPAPPEDPEAPVLEKVTLVPASATLAPGTTRQFKAYGTSIAGDSVSVSVVFASTGGTVTGGGLYTAGSTPGTYRIIATSGTLADTSALTVTRPSGSGPAAGIPFGAFGALSGTEFKPNTENLTLNIGATTASTIAGQITQARARNMKLILAMTGGAHANYLSVIDGVLQFDYRKWKARMDTYNTAAIRDAVANGVADGTIVGNYVMDEPNVTGAGDGNTWGPKGTMTKARVDTLCSVVKQMFPTMTVGSAHNHDTFEPNKSYRVCEFLIDQYADRKGDITTWRDEGLALARRDGHAVVFSLNTLNGGIQAKRDGLWDCPAGTTGGRGNYDPNCRMTPQQIREFSRVLGPSGCALLMWRYDANMMRDSEYQSAFQDVAEMLAATPAKSCRRE